MTRGESLHSRNERSPPSGFVITEPECAGIRGMEWTMENAAPHRVVESATSTELHKSGIPLRREAGFLTYWRTIGAKRVAPLAVYRARHIVVAHEQSSFL